MPLQRVFLKLNFDVAVDKRFNFGATEVVARDHNGRFLDWCCHLWCFLIDSIVYRETFILTENRAFTKVVMEADSASVIDALKGVLPLWLFKM